MFADNINENELKQWTNQEFNLNLNNLELNDHLLKKQNLQKILIYLIGKVKNKRNAKIYTNLARYYNLLQEIKDNNQQFQDLIDNDQSSNDYKSMIINDNHKAIVKTFQSFIEFYSKIINDNQENFKNLNYLSENKSEINRRLIEKLRQTIELMETKIFNNETNDNTNESKTIIKMTEILKENSSKVLHLFRMIQEQIEAINSKNEPKQIESNLDLNSDMNEIQSLKYRLQQLQYSTMAWQNIVNDFEEKKF